MDTNEARKMAIKALQRLIFSISEEMLKDTEKVEFFNTYQEDIIEMLEIKIRLLRQEKKVAI